MEGFNLIRILNVYYPPRPHHFDAIREGYFYFCKVSKLNDPYDASFNLIQSPKFPQYTLPKLSPNAKNIMDNYGTCSFCEERDNKVMWALYADNYSGFVVEFDDSTFESLNLDLSVRISYQKVVYRTDCPDLDNTDYTFNYRNYEGEVQTIHLSECLQDEKTMDKLFTHLCSYKNEVWEKEKEWRLIAGNDILQRKNPKVEYDVGGYIIPMPQNAIKSIIIGHNFSKDRYCCIKDVANKLGIPVYRTKVYMPFCIEFEDAAF